MLRIPGPCHRNCPGYLCYLIKHETEGLQQTQAVCWWGQMRKPQIPANEEQRLAALGVLGMLYSPSEERFDRITRLARKVFDVPIALVSLVAEDCQWFKSAQGLTADQTSREISFCGHAILMDEAMVVPDALTDERFADNPLVTGPPFLRFYAGHPVEYQGKKLGTLCLIDHAPRTFSADEREDLRSMALWVQNEISVTALSEAQVELLIELGAAKRQSMIDPLTRTWNRHGIEELLAKELARARREQSSVCIMLVDIDDFSRVTGAHSQAIADAVLMETAQRIRTAIRPQDLIGRLEGDRFLLFLGDCFTNRAAGIAQRILTCVNETPVDAADQAVTISISVGAACVASAEHTDVQALTALARAALNEARQEGGKRARVRTLTQDKPPTP